jgi:hypothetical protein
MLVSMPGVCAENLPAPLTASDYHEFSNERAKIGQLLFMTRYSQAIEIYPAALVITIDLEAVTVCH